MIKGVGIDSIEISRFRERKDIDDFLKQILSETECLNLRGNLKKDVMAAKVFTIKEAILKALGCGLHSGSYWKDIELSKGFSPTLRGVIGRLAKSMSISSIHVAHGDSKLLSVAVVILE
ncbi:MAG: holo-ACP synthase [Bacteroidota bacterium]